MIKRPQVHIVNKLGKPSKKKDKLGLLAQPRGGRGRKGLGVPNLLNCFLKICLE